MDYYLTSRSLAERNMSATAQAEHDWKMPIGILDDSNERLQDSERDEHTKDFLDSLDGVSGDDLARLTRGPK